MVLLFAARMAADRLSGPRLTVFEGLAALPAGERFLDGAATPIDVGEGNREAAYLGMRPDQGQLAPGPLMVSALRADPPERSTHFHLALLSVDDNGQVHETEGELEPGVLDRLRTRSLVPIPGYGKQHGLVWENVGSLRTVAARETVGRSLRESLPEGDPERALRRLIDDSTNLLTESEANRRLRDEGKAPANLLWPWGAGIRLPVPNLALERLTPARVSSRSWRLAGLSRLAGYRPAAWHRPDPDADKADLRVIRLPEDPEEALYEIHRWRKQTEPSHHAIVLTDGRQAIGLRTDLPSNGDPFDERLLEEDRSYPGLWTWMSEAWASMGNPDD
ncbi:hypothetical protein BH11ARM2_BH11ARM2_33830 [soil metagenome]